jgi:hypothetical protein
MALTWLFFPGWSQVFAGQFARIKITLTIGIVLSLRGIRRSSAGFALTLLFAVFQVLVFRVSMSAVLTHQERVDPSARRSIPGRSGTIRAAPRSVRPETAAPSMNQIERRPSPPDPPETS